MHGVDDQTIQGQTWAHQQIAWLGSVRNTGLQIIVVGDQCLSVRSIWLEVVVAQLARALSRIAQPAKVLRARGADPELLL